MRRIDEAAEQWAVLTLCRALLDETLTHMRLDARNIEVSVAEQLAAAPKAVTHLMIRRMRP